MGASSENFCLRWNDFESNVSGAFAILRKEQDFFDVTLSCSDSGGRSLQAHKVILSACSSFFKGMLKSQAKVQNHPNPFIYLRGVSFSDLKSVLDFMYNGEVNVAQEDLNSFLAVAEELQIKGLTNKEGAATGGEPSKKIPRRPTDSGGPAMKKARRSPPRSATSTPSKPGPSTDGDVKAVDIKSDPEAGPSGAGAAVQDYGDGNDFGDESFGDGYYDEGEGGDMLAGDMGGAEGQDGDSGGKGMAVDDFMIQEHENESEVSRDFGPTRLWRCKICNYRTRLRHNMKLHILGRHSKHENLPCDGCGNTYKNRQSLRVHRSLCIKKLGLAGQLEFGYR